MQRRSLLDFVTGLVCAVLVLVGTAYGAVWEDQGFSLHIGGWYTPEIAQGWSGLLLGLTMPDAGMLMLYDAGALEVYIPDKGWVRDDGITVFYGCERDPATMQDTSLGPVTLLPDMECSKERSRVLMIARIPRVHGTASNLPTKARWVPRKEMHYEDR